MMHWRMGKQASCAVCVRVALFAMMRWRTGRPRRKQSNSDRLPPLTRRRVVHIRPRPLSSRATLAAAQRRSRRLLQASKQASKRASKLHCRRPSAPQRVFPTRPPPHPCPPLSTAPALRCTQQATHRRTPRATGQPLAAQRAGQGLLSWRQHPLQRVGEQETVPRCLRDAITRLECLLQVETLPRCPRDGKPGAVPRAASSISTTTPAPHTGSLRPAARPPLRPPRPLQPPPPPRPRPHQPPRVWPAPTRARRERRRLSSRQPGRPMLLRCLPSSSK